MTTANDLWVTASALLRSQVSDGVWQSTFAQVSPLDLAGDTFSLALPNGIIRDRLNGRYRPLVEDAVNEAAGRDIELEFHLIEPTLFDADTIDLTNEPSTTPPATIDLAAAEAGAARGAAVNAGGDPTTGPRSRLDRPPSGRPGGRGSAHRPADGRR